MSGTMKISSWWVAMFLLCSCGGSGSSTDAGNDNGNVNDNRNDNGNVNDNQNVNDNGNVGENPFFTEPYLQNVKSDGITVMWEAPGGLASSLEHGADASYGSTVTPTSEIIQSSSLVNEWTLVMDVRYPAPSGSWRALYQTDVTNVSDADCFIRNTDGAIGVSDTGYSAFQTSPDVWYRVVVVVDNGTLYDLHVDGSRVLDGAPQSSNSRFALDAQLLLFADENGEDQEVHVSYVALYDGVLSSGEVASLGAAGDNNALIPGTAQLAGEWDFDDVGNLLLATTGNDLTLVGSQAAVAGVVPGDGAARIGLGSHYVCDHGIATTSDSRAVYKAEITGLSAGAGYHFRVVAGDYESEDRTFVTTPGAGTDFSFGVFGDTQGVSNATAPMMIHLAQSGVDLAVGVGDHAEDGSSYSSVREFHLDRVVNNVSKTIPTFLAWGNHDQGAAAVIRAFSDHPSEDRGPPFDSGYGSFSFEYAGCHFLLIDDADRFDYAFIDNDLAAAQGSRAIFVFVHRAPYYERWYDGEAEYRTNLVPLLEQHDVDILFSGHMHGYHRGLQNGVYYVVTGGGSWLDIVEPLVYDWPHLTVGGYHDLGPGVNGGLVNEYVKVEVTATTVIARMFAFNPDGTPMAGISDTFSF